MKHLLAIAVVVGLYLVLLTTSISCNLLNQDELETSSPPTSVDKNSSFTEFATGAKPNRIPKKTLNESLKTNSIKTRTRSQTLTKEIDNKCIWTQGVGLEEVNVRAIRKLKTNTLIAGGFGTHHGIYKSEDHGKTWDQTPFFPPLSEASGTEVWDLETNLAGRIYATVINNLLAISNEAMRVPSLDSKSKETKKEPAKNPPATRGIFYSDDDGDSWSVMTSWGKWTSIIPVGASVVYMGNMWWQDSSPGSVWAITVNSGWPATSETDMYNMIGEVISQPPQNGIFDLYMSGQYIIATAPTRLYRMPVSEAVPYSYSSVGQYPWEVKLIGKNPRYFVDDGNGNIFVSTDGYGIYRSANDGNTWMKLTGGGLPEGGNITQLVSPLPSILIAGVSGHGVYRSTDNGINFDPLTTEGLESLYVQSMEITGTGAILAGTKSGIFSYPRHCLN